MTDTRFTEPSPAAVNELGTLPAWPSRTIALLATLGHDGPHVIPVSAPVRGGDHRLLLNLHRSRESLGRLREHPRVALATWPPRTPRSRREGELASSRRR